MIIAMADRKIVIAPKLRTKDYETFATPVF